MSKCHFAAKMFFFFFLNSSVVISWDPWHGRQETSERFQVSMFSWHRTKPLKHKLPFYTFLATLLIRASLKLDWERKHDIRFLVTVLLFFQFIEDSWKRGTEESDWFKKKWHRAILLLRIRNQIGFIPLTTANNLFLTTKNAVTCKLRETRQARLFSHKWYQSRRLSLFLMRRVSHRPLNTTYWVDLENTKKTIDRAAPRPAVE